MGVWSQSNATDGAAKLDVLTIGSDTSVVTLPFTGDRIERSFRTGDDLVLVLVDGGLLVIEGYYAPSRLPSVHTQHDVSEEVMQLKVTESGDFAGYELVERGRLDEAFGDGRLFRSPESDSDVVDSAAAPEEVEELHQLPEVVNLFPDTDSHGKFGLSVSSTEGKWLIAGGVAALAAFLVLSGDDEDSEGAKAAPNDPPDDPPVGTSEDPPVGTSEDPPVGTSEDPPVGTSEDPPVGTSEDPPVGTSDDPPDVEGTPNVTEVDTDGDGDIDRTEYDADRDGIPERIVHHAASPGAVARTEFDPDDDGNIDRTEYDADGDGNAERIEHDQNEDGTVDRLVLDSDDDGTSDTIEDYDFDANGRLSRKRIDENASSNGVYESIESYAYDGNSNSIIRTEFDTNGNGTADRIEHYDTSGGTTRVETSTFDRNGRLLQKDIDESGNGSADRVEYYSETNGRLTRIDELAYTGGQLSRRSIDSDASDNGTFEEIERYFYTSDGDLSRTEYDTDANGSPDWIRNHYFLGSTASASIEVLEYNSGGQVSKRYFDTDFSNGTNYESIETYTYDSKGRLETKNRDTDASDDGTYEEIESYTYADGGLDSVKLDTNADGSTDILNVINNDGGISRIILFEYVEGGRFRALDNDVDGRIEYREFLANSEDGVDFSENYDYDSNGNLVRLEYDEWVDEVVDNIETYEYDLRGNRIKASFDTNASDDGTYERIETYAYGTDSIWEDIHVRTEIDANANGTVDSIVYYDINGGATNVETYVYGANTVTVSYAEVGLDGTSNLVYHREKVTTDNGNGTTSVEETEYRISGGSRTPVITRHDTNGDGIVDSVVNYDADGNAIGQPVENMETSVEFDSDNSLSYTQVTRGTDGIVREILFPTDDDYEFQPTAADGTAWQNVDTIALFNRDDEDGVYVGSEGSTGDVTLILTDEFVDALMANRGADDHILIWGDEGDTILWNDGRYDHSVHQDYDTHQMFSVLEDGALLGIGEDMATGNIPESGNDAGSLLSDTEFPI